MTSSSKNLTVSLICEECGNPFLRKRKYIHEKMFRGENKGRFCSQKCIAKNNNISFNLNCKQCNSPIYRAKSQIFKNVFCSQSCSATFNNVNKRHGTRRSKLETWLESKLKEKYPKLEIDFNKKDAINSELDIYIPSLKLAFELNGLFHYEPIFGQDKLNQIQNNDQRKFQACLEKGIEFCIIDTSKLKYFKEQNCIKYLDIISNIINTKLVP